MSSGGFWLSDIEAAKKENPIKKQDSTTATSIENNLQKLNQK